MISAVLGVILLAANGAQAQWSGSPNIYYNGGNVGIGTTSPVSQLTVTNTTTVGAGSAGAGVSLASYPLSSAQASSLNLQSYGNNNSWVGWSQYFNGTSWITSAPHAFKIYDYNNYLGFYADGGLTAGNSFTPSLRMVLLPGGNVGIGTAGPNHALSVTGNTGFQGNFWYATHPGINIGDNSDHTVSATRRMQLYVNTTGNYGSIQALSQGVSYLPLVLQESGGNVGVGTTSPSEKLHVAGGNLSVIRNEMSTWLANNTAGGEIDFLANAYYSSGWKYRLTDEASVMQQENGNFRFYTAASGTADTAITWTERLTILNGGSVGIGTPTPTAGYKLDVNGDTRVGGNINLTGTINAKYQDVAEWVASSEQLAAGTVVVLDSTKSNQVVSSSQSYDTRVAGVISAQPGITLGEKGDGKVLVATTGRVKIKVDAGTSSIQIGDLLVTSNIPGVAMKSEAVNLGGVQIHRPGTLIGKALEPLAKGSGEILVLLSLQ